MKNGSIPPVTRRQSWVRDHAREVASYCGVPVAAVVWWRFAGIPAAYRRDVQRLSRVIDALSRRFDPPTARALLRLVIRAADDRRLLRAWRRGRVRRPRYRMVVRS